MSERRLHDNIIMKGKLTSLKSKNSEKVKLKTMIKLWILFGLDSKTWRQFGVVCHETTQVYNMVERTLVRWRLHNEPHNCKSRPPDDIIIIAHDI